MKANNKVENIVKSDLEYIDEEYGMRAQPSLFLTPVAATYDESCGPLPLDALPKRMAFLIIQTADVMQVPASMVLQSLLVAAAASVQHSTNVEYNGFVYNTAIMAIGVAESGERKSSTAKLVLNKIIEIAKQAHTKSHKRILQDDIKERRIKTINKRREEILTKLTDQSVEEGSIYYNNLETEGIELTRELDKLLSKRSSNHLAAYNDITMITLLDRMQETNNALILDDEGAKFIEMIKSYPTILCKMYDGDDYTFDRKKEAPIIIKQPKLSGNIMLQTEILSAILARKKAGTSIADTFVKSGTAARFLFLKHAPVAGLRNTITNFQRPHLLDGFEMLIEAYISNEEQRTLTLSAVAESNYGYILQDIENSIKRDQDIAILKPSKSRCGQNLLKIAAILHLFGDNPTTDKISYEEIQGAHSLMIYFESNYLALFGEFDEQLAIEETIKRLLQWIFDKHLKMKYDKKHDAFCIERSFLLKYGPSGKYGIRKAEQLERVVAVLPQYGLAYEDQSPINGMTYLYITPKGMQWMLDSTNLYVRPWVYAEFNLYAKGFRFQIPHEIQDVPPKQKHTTQSINLPYYH